MTKDDAVSMFAECAVVAIDKTFASIAPLLADNQEARDAVQIAQMNLQARMHNIKDLMLRIGPLKGGSALTEKDAEFMAAFEATQGMAKVTPLPGGGCIVEAKIEGPGRLTKDLVQREHVQDTMTNGGNRGVK